MAILFYDHLITKSEIEIFLEASEEADNQKGKALQLVDDIIFQGIVSFILENLETHHHHTFLTHVHERPYDPEIISYLRDNIGPHIEDDIRTEADHLVKMILHDLQIQK